jgi:hypothetical protein
MRKIHPSGLLQAAGSSIPVPTSISGLKLSDRRAPRFPLSSFQFPVSAFQDVGPPQKLLDMHRIPCQPLARNMQPLIAREPPNLLRDLSPAALAVPAISSRPTVLQRRTPSPTSRMKMCHIGTPAQKPHFSKRKISFSKHFFSISTFYSAKFHAKQRSAKNEKATSTPIR